MILESIQSVLSGYRKKVQKNAAAYNKKPFAEKDLDSKKISGTIGAIGGGAALAKIHNNDNLTPIQKAAIASGAALLKGGIFRYLTKPRK